MAKLNWKSFDAKYDAAIRAVATKNDVDMGVGRDMLIKMVCEPDEELKAAAIAEYGPIPEGIDHEELKADWFDVLNAEEE